MTEESIPGRGRLSRVWRTGVALELGPENGCVTMGGRGHNTTTAPRFLGRGHSQAEARTGRATPTPPHPPSRSIAGDGAQGLAEPRLSAVRTQWVLLLYPISQKEETEAQGGNKIHRDYRACMCQAAVPTTPGDRGSLASLTLPGSRGLHFLLTSSTLGLLLPRCKEQKGKHFMGEGRRRNEN